MHVLEKKNGTFWILIKRSLEYVCKGIIEKTSVSTVMAWHRTCDKPFPTLTHVHASRPKSYMIMGYLIGFISAK